MADREAGLRSESWRRSRKDIKKVEGSEPGEDKTSSRP